MTARKDLKPEDYVFCGHGNHTVQVKDARRIHTSYHTRWICLKCAAKRTTANKARKGNKDDRPERND